MARKKIGLALSGGAARGFAHVGVLRLLVENGVPIDMVAGTSAGSILGGAIASGMSIEKIENMSRSIGWTDIGRPSLSPLGLLQNEPLGRYLAKHFPVTRFEEMPIPFAAIACDLQTGDEVVLKDKGDAIFAIRASCAVPGIFTPSTDEDDRMLVDGGAVRPLPCSILKKMGADVIIAVDVLACGSTFRSKPRTALGVSIQAAMTIIRTVSRNQHYRADIVIKPEIAHLRPDELGKRDEFIELGADATLILMDRIKVLL